MTNVIFVAMVVLSVNFCAWVLLDKEDSTEVKQAKFIRASLTVIVILLAMIVVRMP